MKPVTLDRSATSRGAAAALARAVIVIRALHPLGGANSGVRQLLGVRTSPAWRTESWQAMTFILDEEYIAHMEERSCDARAPPEADVATAGGLQRGGRVPCEGAEA